MFSVFRPPARTIQRFIAESQTLPLSYGDVGLTRSAGTKPTGGDMDETVTAIGRGPADFARARSALGAWKQFDLGWVELFPNAAPPVSGTVVAVLIHHLGFWSLNGARVIYDVVDDGAGSTRFGFAYGTLSNHAESGEELFEVSLNPESDEVLYRIRAFSRPGALLTRLGYPIDRLLQARFRRESVEAMRRATRGIL